MRQVGDPVMYFEKYPGRFISMHLQGVDTNAPLPAPGGQGRGQGRGPGRGGRGGRNPGLAVGKDTLDWPKIFAAAKKGGIKNYFVEQSWDLTVAERGLSEDVESVSAPLPDGESCAAGDDQRLTCRCDRVAGIGGGYVCNLETRFL